MRNVVVFAGGDVVCAQHRQYSSRSNCAIQILFWVLQRSVSGLGVRQSAERVLGC